MSWIKNMLRRAKVALFGEDQKPKAEVAGEQKAAAESLAVTFGGWDQGPATRAYVKRCFPPSIFTKALTPQRRKYILEVMRRLRPEQRAIARAHGYTKGVC